MIRLKDLFGPRLFGPRLFGQRLFGQHRGLADGALLGTALAYNAYIIYYLWRLLTAH